MHAEELQEEQASDDLYHGVNALQEYTQPKELTYSLFLRI